MHLTAKRHRVSARQDLARRIGRRLVAIRGIKTQMQFASELGMHFNTLARYERGERLPDAWLLSQLIARGVNIHWLLRGAVPIPVSGVPEPVRAAGWWMRLR